MDCDKIAETENFVSIQPYKTELMLDYDGNDDSNDKENRRRRRGGGQRGGGDKWEHIILVHHYQFQTLPYIITVSKF
jgi:hypothetical protein